MKPRQDGRARGPAAPPGPQEQIAPLSAAKVLERIGRARLQRDELDAELTLLIDHASAWESGGRTSLAAWASAGRRPASNTSADTETPAVMIAWPDIIPGYDAV